MQLSPSTLPLDPSLAGPIAADTGVISGAFASANAEDAPEFGDLLSSETEPGSSDSTDAATSPLAAEVSGDTPAPAPAVNQDVVAAWLVANGFQPATPAPTDVNLLGTTTETADLLVASDEASNSPVVAGDTVATSGRGSGVAGPLVAPEHAPRAVARAYTFATPRLQTATTENVSEEPVAGKTVAGEQPTAKTVPASPADHVATAARSFSPEHPAPAAVVSNPRAMIPRAASMLNESPLPSADVGPADLHPTLDEAATLTSAAVAISPELAKAQSRAFAGHVQPTLAPVTKNAEAPSVPPALPTETGAENFAVQPETSRGDDLRRGGKVEKHSLSTNVEDVTAHSSGFGINAAKTETLMPALATPAASSPPVAGIEHLSPAPATFDALVNQAGHEATAMAQAARRSVDSALAVAEQFATGDKRAVTLQFSVSGVDLGVHVELRGDGVHTTFRTDSPELRAALAQEWQAVTGPQPGERASRFVDPVFTSTASGNSHSDANGADQRGSNPHQDRRLADDLAALQVAPRQRSAAVAAAPLPSAPRHTPLSTSNRLHTFA